MATTSNVIEARSLTKRFGRHSAPEGIDLSIGAGSVFGLIGPNGAGKTTAMRLMVDVIRPTSGTLRILGGDPRSAGPSLRARIGYLPGELRLESRITGRAMLNHFAEISGPVASGTINDLADRLHLELDRPVRTLSKGNKQKLGLVQAFMHRPPLLILDEPTSGLDPLVQQEFLAMVREARNDGQTVFLSSHVLSEIQQAADEVALLRAGRIITVSTVDELRAAAVRHVRARFASTTPDAVRSSVAGVASLSSLEVAGAQDVTTLTATVSGEIDAFVKAIARFTIVDLVVEEPDLEESVLTLYETGETDAKH
ncbi:ABC transporter ATP-binding protein [Agreia bicolorata]|uniref:ABC transporter ATP-binding protein n=1 Tax=Agreia bicolorata TaxID=110935 RepID=UPI0005CA6DA2|nr:ABC transporter ATP-binding protein [Agreia bicolorata]